MANSTDDKINWEDLMGLNENQIEDKAKEILSKMTLKEKADQMTGDKSIFAGFLQMAINYIKEGVPAGRNDRLGIPPIKFTDGPKGINIGNSTCFPVAIARGATWDIDLERRIGDAIGIEARSHNASFFGGVCINLIRHPAWGRSQETYSEDPVLLGEFGSAIISGVQAHKVMCNAKHYACNSMENVRFKVNVKIDERTLREVYLPHFKKCVEDGVASIMSAYNRVNGKYCGHNEILLRDILKKDWNFKGFVISDFFWGIRDGELAIKGGMDIEMPFRWKMNVKKVLRLIKNGIISEELLDDANIRILRQKIKFATRSDPSKYNLDKVACKEHVQLALEAARKSITLLKNEKDMLPLDRNNPKKILVVGKIAKMDNLGDSLSSKVDPPYVITALDGIKKAAGEKIEIIYDRGKKLKNLVALAQTVDIVIFVVGLTDKDEGEYLLMRAGDRERLEIKKRDEKLINAVAHVNKNCIIILEGGSAIITEAWRENVPVILMAWYPGMEGGTAIGEILFGDVNPCGKLPLTFPKSQNQLPFYFIKAREIDYGYYHGYKLLDKDDQEPAFAFGFGLSYTSYKYENLRLDKSMIKKNESVSIKVDVTNTGQLDGEEIIQIYVGYKNSAVDRPKKDLKGFGRIQLKAGETKTFTKEILAKDLAYYDVDAGEWKVEVIEYLLHVGSSSKMDDLITTSFTIQE